MTDVVHLSGANAGQSSSSDVHAQQGSASKFTTVSHRLTFPESTYNREFSAFTLEMR